MNAFLPLVLSMLCLVWTIQEIKRGALLFATIYSIGSAAWAITFMRGIF